MSDAPTIEEIISEWESTLRYGYALAQLRTGSEDAAFHALVAALERGWEEDEAEIPTRSQLMERVARELPLRRTA